MTDPSNSYVFVTSLGGDVILQFKIDRVTGQATPNTSPFVATQKGGGAERPSSPNLMATKPKPQTTDVSAA